MLITISRQYLAGGSQVAAQVAETLGWTVIDDALIDVVAKRSDFTPDDVRDLEESGPTFMERFAHSSALASPEAMMSTPSVIDGEASVRLAHLTRQAIEEFSQRSRIVFVGRAAAAILSANQQAIHVRLVAKFDSRVRKAIDEFGWTEDEASETVRRMDEGRARYHQEHFGRNWDDSTNYHMVLNTDVLGVVGAAELVVARARSLGWAVEE